MSVLKAVSERSFREAGRDPDGGVVAIKYFDWRTERYGATSLIQGLHVSGASPTYCTSLGSVAVDEARAVVVGGAR